MSHPASSRLAYAERRQSLTHCKIAGGVGANRLRVQPLNLNRTLIQYRVVRRTSVLKVCRKGGPVRSALTKTDARSGTVLAILLFASPLLSSADARLIP
jgi:hypothetical protein